MKTKQEVMKEFEPLPLGRGSASEKQWAAHVYYIFKDAANELHNMVPDNTGKDDSFRVLLNARNMMLDLICPVPLVQAIQPQNKVAATTIKRKRGRPCRDEPPAA